ncbi:unnamed protein product [Trichobilharzia regenti]|nr:unnamed protein product [Trichobilharzia regenti]
MIPIVASLSPEHNRIEPVQFIDSLCALQQDSKLTALKDRYRGNSRYRLSSCLLIDSVLIKILGNISIRKYRCVD